MAVIKIFPNKDTFISENFPNYNYGRDEILELKTGRYKSDIIVGFNGIEINKYLDKNPKIYFNLYYANGYIPTQYKLYAYNLENSWIMGTGKEDYYPNPQDGACWDYPTYSGSNWISGSNFDYQNFDFTSSKDVKMELNEIKNYWSGSSEVNILLKMEEFQEDYNLKFYSHNTHTIYPPNLEIHWDDSIYSSSLPIIKNNFVSTIINLKEEYNSNENIKFQIKNRDVYPTRIFTTSSLYLEEKILPPTSYWGVMDYKTNEMVIDFNEIGTKISADDEGNYFLFNFNGLEPRRYYKFIFKVILNDEVIIVDNKNNYFKVK